MKLKLIIILILSVFTLRQGYTQEYLTMDRDQIKMMFDSWEDSLSIKDQPNFLEVLVDGNDKFVAKYYFDEEKKCDSIHISYSCWECAQQHINFVLNDKKGKWFITDNDYTFLSKKRISWHIGFSKNRMSECKQIIFIKTPEEEICTTMIITKVEMKSRIWKDKINLK